MHKLRSIKQIDKETSICGYNPKLWLSETANNCKISFKLLIKQTHNYELNNKPRRNLSKPPQLSNISYASKQGQPPSSNSIRIFRVISLLWNYQFFYNSLMLLSDNKNFVTGVYFLRSMKLLYPLTKALSRSLFSSRLSLPEYRQNVANIFQNNSICFIQMGKFYNSSSFVFVIISLIMSKSFLAILFGSFMHLSRYLYISCINIDSYPM